MTRYPDIPPIIESHEHEYRDSGIPSKVALAGHPFHPLIVTFPIAFLVGVLATDVAYWLTRNPFWAQVSVVLLGAGLVMGVLAAATGLVDFFYIKRVRERSAGWIHLVGNIVALALSLVSLLIRWNNPVNSVLPTGIILSVVVAVLLGVTGWYGAELVYRHKIAVIGTGDRQTS